MGGIVAVATPFVARCHVSKFTKYVGSVNSSWNESTIRRPDTAIREMYRFHSLRSALFIISGEDDRLGTSA